MPVILGVWDGHDAGAALLRDDEILAAVNEERFTRRKLEVSFPSHSIRACLKIARIHPEEVDAVAAATFDFSKTLSRFFPGSKEHNYQVRRRKKSPPFLHLQKKMKFFLTGIGPSWWSRKLSTHLLIHELKKIGFRHFDFFLFDHHQAHAATAAYCSPLTDPAAVITVDGVGDGSSATVNIYDNHKLTRIAEISAQDSLGVFFEQVTYLLNMRELEDEGKVMALASYHSADGANPLLDFFKVDDLSIKARYPPTVMFSKLEAMAWKLPWEEFAWMAQSMLESKMVELFHNAQKATRFSSMSWAGGVGANIKVNQRIRKLPEIRQWFIFPHMGDGGIALGAALCARAALGKTTRVPFPHVYLGPNYSEEQILSALKSADLPARPATDIEAKTAELLADDQVVLWFQGAMEFGPRALGNRSILAPPNNLKVKETLNTVLKRRSWFQPFCPTILSEAAPEYLEDFDQSRSPFMTMGYQVKPEKFDSLKGVIAEDGSCRPQLLQDENPRFRKLLLAYQQMTGCGALLNTSFNRHGEPLVNTPEQAISIFLESGFPYLVLDHFLLEHPNPKTTPQKSRVFSKGGSIAS